MIKQLKNTVFLVIVLFPCSVYAGDIVFEGDSVEWIFTSEHGLWKEVRSTIQPENRLIFDPPCSLWEFKGKDENLSAETTALHFSFSSEGNTKYFRWTYNPTDMHSTGAPFEVILKMVVLQNGTLEMWFTCQMNAFHFDEIYFPEIRNIDIGPDRYPVIPYWMGEVYDSRIYPGKNTGFIGAREWEYPGTLSMQWIGLYTSSSLGISLWMKDADQNYKTAYLYGDGKQGGMGWKHWIQKKTDGTISIPFPACISVIHGDWYEMALLYREWAREQFWTKQSRKNQGSIAPWVEDTALWVWNRLDSEKVLSPAIDMADRLQLPISVLWHWWHGCAYDIGFPEYLPPREGYKSFSDNLNKAKGHGIHTLIYVNQRLWGTTTSSWKEKNAEQYAVHDKEGKIHEEVYNIFQPAPCVPMCMGTAFWRETLLNIMVPIWNISPIAGFYLDQACASLPCFATNHGHEPGEKGFWIKGFQELTLRIRSECESGKDDHKEAVVLAGEGCGEAWLPYLDLFLSLQVSKGRYSSGDGWRPVPLFQAVYHPVAIQFGNYASLTEPPYDTLWPKEFAPAEPLKTLAQRWSTQFCYEQACAFVWGQQPMIANYKTELWNERRDELEFVLQLAKLRYKFREFFLNGELLKPLPEDMPDTWDEICLSVYAYRKEGGKIFNRRGNLLLTMPWRTHNGKTALVVANADDKERLLKFTIDTKKWSLPNEGTIIQHDINNSIPVASYSNGIINFSQIIKKHAILLFEFQ